MIRMIQIWMVTERGGVTRRIEKQIVDSDSEDEERIWKRKMRRPKFKSEDESSDEEEK